MIAVLRLIRLGGEVDVFETVFVVFFCGVTLLETIQGGLAGLEV